MRATGSSGRTTSTVLFTDLVGSTELRARLGEETAEGLRRQHDRVVAEAITVNGGRVVKNLGDGVMATFMGAPDARGGQILVSEIVRWLTGSGLWKEAVAGGKPGDADRARQLLGQALATARELGLAHVERRTLALLQ